MIGLEQDEALAREAEAQLTGHGADNVVIEQGPLARGIARHGPFDAIIIEGGVELVPEAFDAQLKPGGRIVAIFMDGARGQAKLGLRTAQGIAWRRIFDATAPVLPGFQAVKAFEF